MEVQHGRKAKTTAAQHPDPNARGNARAAQIEPAAGGEPQQRGLEAGGVAGSEKLLGIGPRSARPAHLAGYVEVDVETAIAGARVTFAAACDACFRCVKSLE